jgi:hypothetical protein
MTLKPKKITVVKKHTRKSTSKDNVVTRNDFVKATNFYNSLENYDEKKYKEFISATKEIRDYTSSRNLTREVAIIVAKNEDGVLYSDELFIGEEKEASMPLVRWSRGAVHSHANKETEYSFLPSMSDLYNTAAMTEAFDVDEFVCGVVNFRGRATLTVVDKKVYYDKSFKKYVSTFKEEKRAGVKKEVTRKITLDCIDYLRKHRLIKIYKIEER